ncbi:6-carboxytetrahydropterin synthase [Porphyromonas pogonae]|uniref:6-pyruvoyl trahydropterin synthase family protein n=1 Tax=Porphyromonas pogonae TaxID=867595 RepID=UPI002E76342A|nr:6-carboxytetrahydropterin synthase [Porphyromonas pogonae]
MVTAERYHDICMGHRVVGHENKCRHLHGHNYRIFFKCTSDQLDELGRVIDFAVIKEKLCMWLENQWDHKMILWEKDPLLKDLKQLIPEDIIEVPFNPTAENIAMYLVNNVGPEQLGDTGVTLIECRVEETRKCSATYHTD